MSISNTLSHAPNTGAQKQSGLVRFARVAFIVTAAVFALCVGAQVFIAGMATFAGPQNWGLHVTFVHFFEFLPLLMLLFAFLGKLPANLKWASGGQFLLIFYMYFAANIRGINPMLAATHPVVAMIIFALAIWTVMHAWRMIRQ